MIVYFVLFLVILLFSLVDLKSIKSRYLSVFSVLSISIIIFLFAGLRFEVGTDYLGYKEIFDRVYFGESVNVEYGYILISKFYQSFSNNYILFIVLLFLLAFSLKLIAFIKITPFVSYSLLIYFTTILISSDINQLRMGLSFSVIFFSIYYIIIEKKWFFYFSVFLAGSIHYSAFIFLPAFIISNLRLNFRAYTLLLFISLLNFFLFKIFIIDSIGLDILFLLNESYQNKYSVYLDNVNDFDSLFTILSRLLIFICFFFYQQNYNSKQNSKLLNLYFFSLLLYLTLSNQGLISSRFSSYYKLSEIIFLPYFFQSFKNNIFNLIVFIILSGYLFLMLYRVLIVPGDLYPYQNLLS